MKHFLDLDLQIFENISKIIDLDIQILDLELQVNDLGVQIYDIRNNIKNMEVQSMIFEILLKIWRSKSSTHIQDWPQVMVFEIVYLLLQTVFEITRIIRGTQIAN